MVLANVPSFRFSFRGNIRRNHPFGNHPFVKTKKGHWEIKGRFPKGWFWRTYPRSGFRSGGTSAKTTLLETTLLRTPEINVCVPPKFRQVPGCTRSMRAPSCDLWRGRAKFGELWRTHSGIFMRTFLTFTRVPAKVPHIHQSSGEGAFWMWVAFRMCHQNPKLKSSVLTAGTLL